VSASPAPAGRLVIVDAANCLYRAFFALPPLRGSDGTPTHAVLGFVNMLRKVLREEQPDHVVVVFDAPGKSFRSEIYPEYKATRDAQPEDLTRQFPVCREIVAAYRLPVLEVPGVEADDVIATLVATAPPALRVSILSTDKDLMQLVSDRVELLDTMKNRRLGPAEVEERFGVPPEKLLDVRALVGDPSDNIPGVSGIGEKGAAQLIREWGDLDALLAHADAIPGKRAREALLAQAERARLSRRLAALRRDVPLPLSVAELRLREPDLAALRAIFERLGFARLLEGLGEAAPAGPPAAAAPELRVVEDAEGLADLAKELRELGALTLLVVQGEGGPLRDPPVGLAVALSGARAAFVPLTHRDPDARRVVVEDLVATLRPLLEGSGALPFAGAGLKPAVVALAEHGLETGVPAFDTDLAAFLLDPAGQRGTPAVAAQQLDRRVRSFEEVAGRGAKAVAAAALPVPVLAAWAAEEVCAERDLVPHLAGRLAADDLLPLFRDVELPLIGVLARMERAGVRIDEAALARLSAEYDRELQRIEGRIYELAGERFQIASPKQLQRVLFEKLRLPVTKRTKTGFSTAEEVLEELAAQHELPGQILAHRHLAKLKNTYVDAIPPLVNPATGRVHPTFHQTGAATGRLSCSNPNLQNIPIRTPEGVRIREAFVPAEGCLLLSADYSQVELRILAHFSGDESLIEAFRVGEDIHRRTAAEVQGIAPDVVSDDQRARAKAVNFGIIYGLSAFGLAQQLRIATGEAQATIETYFARYQGVREFLDATVAAARSQGYVRTLLGRRRYLPDLASRNRVLRGAAERMAVNTVIQGTAADLIKKAMADVDTALRARGGAARMILQVHDELLLEAPEAEADDLAALVKERMEDVYPLRVPLRVDAGRGRSWREAH
jgi:DNA polymerase-1